MVLPLQAAPPAPKASSSPAAKPTDVQKDMTYYWRVSYQKNLNANDRLFILYKLRAKYETGGANLSELNQEIERWEKIRKVDEVKGEANTAGKLVPVLKAIRLKESPGLLNIVLGLSEPVVPQVVRVEDPSRPDRPILMIDLPNTKERLTTLSKDMRWGYGPLVAVIASQAETGAARVNVEMRGDRPYRVVRSAKEIIIEIKTEGVMPVVDEPEAEPSAPEETAPAAAVPPAAPPAESNRGALSHVPEIGDKDYVIQTGDLLNVQVSPAKELSRETLIQPDGTVVFPLIGTLPVKGLTVEQLAKTLTQKLGVYVSKPHVSVSIKQFSNRNIFVMGKVARPGPVPFKNGLKLLGAITE
ncbi:MAG: polysaccharide biosynthesis/export family protein, partial [Elusimicrobia bacterium]|nr:polysaccharide biosynthesis/export family protein [Elusimicrobiota bacterium]